MTSLFGSFLGVNGGLLAHRGKDDDVSVLAIRYEELRNLVADFTLGHANVILGFAALRVQKIKEIFVNIKQRKLLAFDEGDVHVVRRRAKLLELLAVENVGGNKMDLGVTVLASLGGRHVDDLTRAVLDDDVTALSQSRALHRVGRRRTSIDAVEGHLMILFFSHFEQGLRYRHNDSRLNEGG